MLGPLFVKQPKNILRLLPSPDLPEPGVMVREEPDYSLNIAGVYQDDVTRNWAIDTCRRATHLAGEEHIRDTWFSAASLGDLQILQEAVRAALAADVIVISIHAADELPLDLHVWIDSWLPRRLAKAGALAAVIGVVEPLESRFIRTRGYLEEVARKAELDFIPLERPRPAASAESPNPPEVGGLQLQFNLETAVARVRSSQGPGEK